MTLRELLEADWNVVEISVTVREKDTGRYIMEYKIGSKVEPGSAQRYLYSTPAGDVHGSEQLKVLFIKKEIQYHNLEEKKKGTEACYGVILEAIPKELLDLKITTLNPVATFRSEETKYRIDAETTSWGGINGEYEQITLESERV